MKTKIKPEMYKGHRFPSTIISYCVWLYRRFKLSFRDIQEMSLFRGILVTYER
jgi:putative transposase